MSIDLNTARVGDKVKFAEEKTTYTVQARSERYLICTAPFNPQRTVVYSIIDLKMGIRGPDNLIFGSGYESRGACEDRLGELEAGDIDVSWRRRVGLCVACLVPHVINIGARYRGRDGMEVRVTDVSPGLVTYAGDADGYAQTSDFRKAYVGVPTFRDDKTEVES